MLIAGRMISGVGAAAVLPTTLALMVDGLADRPRRRAIAIWASMTGLAAVLGNVGGGAAIAYGTWRTLFLALIPLALVALLLVAVAAPATARHPRPAAPLGSILLTGGFLALLYGIVSGPQAGWASPAVLGALAVAVLLLTAWTRHELRAAHPLLDPRLLARPAVRAGAVGMAVLFTGMFGLFYLNGQYLQYAKGFGPFGAGLRLLPMAAALLAGPRCGLLLERVCGRRGTVVVGMLVLACGLCTVSAADARTPYALYALGAGLTALGCGTATPLLSHAMMAALPADRAGTGSGLQSLARELGSAVGIAVTGTLTTAVFTARLPAALRGPDTRRRSRRRRPARPTRDCGPRSSTPSPPACTPRPSPSPPPSCSRRSSSPGGCHASSRTPLPRGGLPAGQAAPGQRHTPLATRARRVAAWPGARPRGRPPPPAAPARARPSPCGQPCHRRSRPLTTTAVIWSRFARRTSSQRRSQEGVSSGTAMSTTRKSAALPTAICPVTLPRPRASALPDVACSSHSFPAPQEESPALMPYASRWAVSAASIIRKPSPRVPSVPVPKRTPIAASMVACATPLPFQALATGL